MSRILTGRCLCEAVRFQVPDEFRYALNCHCSQCRKQHGAAFRSRVRIAAGDFRWLAGEHLIKFYESPRGYQRGFCRDCGSPIINKAGPNWKERGASAAAPQYGIALAILDDPPLRPALHCFVASKAPWFEITDDLPQFPEYPPL